MLRTISANRTLWEAILPEECLSLPAGLAEADRLLDDRRFFEPFRPFFDPSQGRPSIPMETYVRMMFLKYRFKLGFELLCREVADSPAWRRFSRIPLGEPVPHPSTLEKITSRYGEPAIDELNEALLAKAAEHRLIKTDKVRADTTVVPANVCYPSDAGLLARGVGRLARCTSKLKAMGLAARTKTRDRSRSMRRRAHAIGTWLRRRNETAKDEVLAITSEMTAIAEAALAEAKTVAANVGRSLRRAERRGATGAAAVLSELQLGHHQAGVGPDQGVGQGGVVVGSPGDGYRLVGQGAAAPKVGVVGEIEGQRGEQPGPFPVSSPSAARAAPRISTRSVSTTHDKLTRTSARCKPASSESSTP